MAEPLCRFRVRIEVKYLSMPDSQYDLVIIGSGPAGSTTARFAAQHGLKVLLVDKRQELGAPIQCSGAVSRHALEEVGITPDAEFIHEPIYGFGIYNGRGEKTTIDYRRLKPEEYGPEDGKKPLGYVVDRRRFDRYLMTQAERAGVGVWLKTLFTISVKLDNVLRRKPLLAGISVQR